MDYSTEDYPGPGAYNPRVEITTTAAPAYSMSKGLRLRTTSSTPGPGTYNFRTRLPGPAFTMSSKPGSLSKDMYPGPGTYTANIDITVPAPPSYSVSERLQSFQPDKFPGPGTYTLKSRLPGPKFSFGQRFYRKSKRQPPPSPPAALQTTTQQRGKQVIATSSKGVCVSPGRVPLPTNVLNYVVNLNQIATHYKWKDITQEVAPPSSSSSTEHF